MKLDIFSQFLDWQKTKKLLTCSVDKAMEKQVLLYISGKTSNGTNFMEVNSAVVIKFTDAFTLEPRNPVPGNLA